VDAFPVVPTATKFLDEISKSRRFPIFSGRISNSRRSLVFPEFPGVADGPAKF